MNLQCVGGLASGKFYELRDRKHLEVQNTKSLMERYDQAPRGQIETVVEAYVEAKVSAAKAEHPTEKSDWAVFRFLKPYRTTDAQAVELLLEKARKFDHLERLMGADYVAKLLKQGA